MGLSQRFAGDLAIGVGIEGLGERDRVLDRMISVAGRLKDHHGADVIILGCAGMAGYLNDLQAAIGIPVIEPTRSAVVIAIGEVLLSPLEGRPRLSVP
jgi:Asp/Glu/hydantoin racemase